MTNQPAQGSGRKIAIKVLVNGAGLYVASLVAKPGVEFLGAGSDLEDKRALREKGVEAAAEAERPGRQ